MNIGDVEIKVMHGTNDPAKRPPGRYPTGWPDRPGAATPTTIRVSQSAIPPTSSVKPADLVFPENTQSSWYLARRDSGWSFVGSPTKDHPHGLWEARVDPEFREVSVACADPDFAPALCYPLNQILVFHALLKNDGLIVHSGGGRILSHGLVYAGPSTAGKSTLSRLLLPSADIELFSDDRMIVRHIDGAWYAYGTPWPGDAGIAVNDRVGLDAMLFLTKSDRSEIREISSHEKLRRLLPVCSIPWYEARWLEKALAICDRLVSDVPMYELRFKPDESARETVLSLASRL